jgi:endoglucanase
MQGRDRRLWTSLRFGGLLVAVAAAALSLAAVTAPHGQAAVPQTSSPRPSVTASTPTATPTEGVRARGKDIVDGSGRVVRLIGFNRSGSEYACVEDWGVFDAPGRKITSNQLRAMRAWSGATVVRLPLNEQCWLGLGVSPEYGGQAYRSAIHDFVDQLNRRGFVVVLDLHRTAPGKAVSKRQEQMPDRDHSVTFWRQVADEYKDNQSVVFDLFNEPWPYGDVSSDRAWTCWRDGGCTLPSRNGADSYVAAGMAELVAAIRGEGATNLLVLGGIHWAETLDRWLDFAPHDPLHNIAAGFHDYPHNTYCASSTCYDTTLAKVALAVPLFAGEIGADDVGRGCGRLDRPVPGFSNRILDWLDAHDASYAAWSWNAWHDPCSLITDYDTGEPTPGWGRQVKARLAANAAK